MPPANKTKTKLPPQLKRYFWDVTFDELTFEKYPRFIAERLLNYSDIEAVRWLLSVVDRQFIKSLLRDSRNLNAKTRNFWQIMLKKDYN
jgi:hypothetical protein